MIKGIVDIRDAPYDTYVGRKNITYDLPESKWANPYLLHRDGTREEVCDKYEKHIRADKFLMESLHELDGKTLGCWCKSGKDPNKLCHGDILIKLRN
ncbi:MAG: DUF4326 domain-containing protein, partial [Nanoarchaeota archaeon]